jgi:hypothetical protein
VKYVDFLHWFPTLVIGVVFNSFFQLILLVLGLVLLACGVIVLAKLSIQGQAPTEPTERSYSKPRQTPM